MIAPWLVLNAVKGLGPVRIKALLDVYGSPEKVLEEWPESIARFGCISVADLSPSVREDLFREAYRHIEKCEMEGVTILTLAHEEYPAMLREIFAPPPVLFVKGSPHAFRRHAIALVGTRRPTAYGRSAAAYLSRELSARGLAIVSGMARGIDTVAHQTCLDENGITIGVLGCGIDLIYPSENTRLAQTIANRGGAIVSEFPPGTPPESFNFPRRNRIISGLAAGVVVIESGEKGGALITARYALQQNREVFAVPGSIFSENSGGTHLLIRNGATPVRTADEIIATITPITTPMGATTSNTAVPPAAEIVEVLSEGERLILEALDNTTLQADQLSEKVKMGVGELSSILLNLELRGLIRQRPGNCYERTTTL